MPRAVHPVKSDSKQRVHEHSSGSPLDARLDTNPLASPRMSTDESVFLGGDDLSDTKLMSKFIQGVTQTVN